ncbi:MAG: Cof-type HAD-IIB family hydrolase [Clostridium sp.]|nr:Cof-type HAD-IIB family hydrolase [Clostridium sp.]
MIKLIVSDMDGTLFNSNQEITPFNLAAIKQANRNGVRFMIATGRSMQTIEPTLQKYDLECGLILMNGAEIRDEKLNIISTLNVDQNVIAKLAEQLEKMGYIPEYMAEKGAFLCGTEEMMEKNMAWRMMCLDRTHTMTFEQAKEAGRTSIFQKNLTRFDSLQKMLEQKVEVRKMIVFHPDTEKNQENRTILQKKFPELSILSSYPENIEINHASAQKGSGLMQAIGKMGIEPDEVAVFGDGYNDISLFELFSHSYAPENAEPDIKAMASEIIPSNNEDGVGIKINELLFHNKIEGANI